jgi:phage shock protein A
LNDRDAENDAYDAELQDHEWAIRRIESFLTSYQTQFAGVETDISAISTQIEGFKTDKNVALA